MDDNEGHQQGSVILLTLLVFFVICILVILVLQLSTMEMHMSEYYFCSLQAQQLADGALEHCCAEISQRLREEYTDKPILELPLGWQEKRYDIVGANGAAVYSIRFEDLTVGTDYCCYKVSLEGSSENAKKNVQANLTFHFSTAAGEEISTIRTFTDYGIITDYKIIYD